MFIVVICFCEEHGISVKYKVFSLIADVHAALRSRLFLQLEQDSASSAQEHKGSELAISIVKNLVTLMKDNIEVSAAVMSNRSAAMCRLSAAT